MVCKLEPQWFTLRPLRFKCLPAMFLLSRILIVKFIRWLVNCLTVSTALPFSDLSVGLEILNSVSGEFSWMKDYNWNNLFKLSLDVNLTVSLIPGWIIKYFDCFQMTGSAWCCKMWKLTWGNFITLTDWSFDKFLSITLFKIESSIKTQACDG